MNYFKQARQHDQAAYGGYCVEARKQGYEPVSYREFCQQDQKKAKKAVKNIHGDC